MPMRMAFLQVKPVKLDIKKDPKGVVTVPGATTVDISSARALLATIERAQQRRHVASTQMNRESSRSHLIISVCIEATNLQTQNVTRGKLSFVDLAGSERCLPLPGPVLPLPPSLAQERGLIPPDSLRCHLRRIALTGWVEDEMPVQAHA